MPEQASFGLFDVKELDGVDVLTASGLGGGSLIGSGAMVRPGEKALAGWPVTRAELEPHLEAAESALAINPYPVEQAPYGDVGRVAAMRSASNRLGVEGEALSLAISFAPDGGPASAGDPIIEQTPNLHHHRRYTCRLVGECNLGCNYGAKNSLDYTCLSAALASGAELRPGCEALELRRRAHGGYEVRFLDWLTRPVERVLGTRTPRLRPQAAGVIGRRVVIAAGALGSTQLLLRSAKQLGRLGPRLGKGFGGNGEHLTVAIGCRASADELGGAAARELLDSAHGPVSTSMLRLPEANGRPATTVHDVGFSDFLAWIAPLLAEPERRSEAQPHRTVRIGAASVEAAEPMPHVRVLRRAYSALTADAPMPPGGWPPGTLAMLVNGGAGSPGRLELDEPPVAGRLAAARG